MNPLHRYKNENETNAYSNNNNLTLLREQLSELEKEFNNTKSIITDKIKQLELKISNKLLNQTSRESVPYSRAENKREGPPKREKREIKPRTRTKTNINRREGPPNRENINRREGPPNRANIKLSDLLNKSLVKGNTLKLKRIKQNGISL
jgi:hypothetical protein